MDHDLPVACLCAEVLEEAGYDVFAAADLPSAMAALSEHRFDAALVDVAMAGGAAVDLASALRAATPDAAVVGLTAEPAHLVRRRAYVDLHLHKPFRRLESIGLAVDAACSLVEHRTGRAPPASGSDSVPASVPAS